MANKSFTANAAVTTTRTRINSIVVSYESGATVAFYDGTVSGPEVFKFTAPASSGAIQITLDKLECPLGAYIAITSATVVVFYEC